MRTATHPACSLNHFPTPPSPPRVVIVPLRCCRSALNVFRGFPQQTSEAAGLRMTWVAYGEKVQIPDFTIRDIVHARQGSTRAPTAEAEQDAAAVLQTLRNMLNNGNGGLSFLYTASIFGDMEGRTVGLPLVIRYVAYVDDYPGGDQIELPPLTIPEDEGNPFTDESDSEGESQLPGANAQSRPRRSSFNGTVNNQKFLPGPTTRSKPPMPRPPPPMARPLSRPPPGASLTTRPPMPTTGVPKKSRGSGASMVRMPALS